MKQQISPYLEITLHLLDSRLMKQRGGLDILMGRSLMVKAHRPHTKGGAEKHQYLQGTFNISLSHLNKIQ